MGEGIQKAYGKYDNNDNDTKAAAPAERYIGNASWNSISASKRPTNVGNINAFQKRQKEQTSQVLEQTDYSHFTPLTSRKVDVNNLNRSASAKHQRFYSNVGFGPKTDRFASPPANAFPAAYDVKSPQLISNQANFLDNNLKDQIRKDYTNYKQQEQRQNFLKSTFDRHTYEPYQTMQVDERAVYERTPTDYETNKGIGSFMPPN